MKRFGAIHRQTFILLTLLLGLGHALVFGATVTATYIPENPVYFTQSPGAFTHESIAGAKLGTIVMTSTGPIYNPGLMTIGDFNANNGIDMSLSFNWGGSVYSRGVKPFWVVAVAYPYGRGGTAFVTTPHNDKWPIMGNTTGVTIYASPFYVDLYLINKNPDSTTNPGSVVATNPPAYYIEPASAITFVSPFNPTFSVGVGSSDEKGVYDYAQGPAGGLTPGTSNGSYVAIDGVEGPDSTTLIDPGGFTSNEAGSSDNGYWFGTEAPQNLNFLFSFLENTASFTLSDAYGTNSKVTINTAQMQVQNGVTGTTYTQKLTFTDSTNDAAFQLSPTSGSGSPIDFKLYFGNEEIEKGKSKNWTGLVNGMNTKILQVGGINATLAEQRVSGAYSDTITVNITSVH